MYIYIYINTCAYVCVCVRCTREKSGLWRRKKSVIDIPERENWPWCCDCCWPGDRVGRTAHPDMHPLLLYIISYTHMHDYVISTSIKLFITVYASVCVHQVIKLEKNNYTPHNIYIYIYTCNIRSYLGT